MRNKKTKNIIKKTVLVVASIMLVAFSLNNFTKEAKADWWDDLWKYRKSVVITNNTTAETNVYVSLILDTSDTAKFQADCGDLRFTKYLGDLLPYYIVSGCGTDTTVVHVNFDTFPAGKQTIFYYYGNPAADNGFSAADFSTAASNYTVGAIGSEEKTDGPLVYFSLNSGYGTTAYDLSQNGNNGTITGGAWKTDEFCVSGKCLEFNGDDLINIANSVPVSDAVTYESWIYLNDKNDGLEYIMDASANGNIWIAQDYSTGSVCTEDTGNLCFNDVCQISSAQISSGKWHHVSASLDSNASKFYLDGMLVCTGAGATPSIGADMKIGEKNDSTGYLKGRVDNIGIYPYVRTDTQIKSDYLSGAAGSGIGSHPGSAVFGSNSKKWMSDGLVGYYKMDSASWNGTTGEVIDYSGAGNHGTAKNGLNTVAAGKFSRAGSFDGIDDYVDVGDVLDMGFSDFTVVGFINTGGSGSAYARLVDKNYSSGYSVFIHNRQLGMSIDGLYNSISRSGAKTLNDNTWYQVVVVFNRSGNAEFYVNGEIDGTVTDISSKANSNLANTSAFEIGNGTTSDSDFNGSIDEVRIYNRALSSDEIKKLYEWTAPPVAYWNFDEKTGTTAYDISGNGKIGTLTGGPLWKNGKVGGALFFDGSNDYVTIADATASMAGDFTIEMWTNPTYDSQNPRIISLIDTAGNKFSGGINASGATVYLRYGGSVVTATGALTYGTWYHIAWVVKGGQKAIFINGINKTTSAAGITADPTFSAIGGGYSASSYTANGLIDEVKFYEYALGEKQIREDMNAGRSAAGSSSGSPIGYWKMNEGYGTTAYDSSGNAKNLTLSSSSWTLDGKFGKAFLGADNKRLADNADDNDFDFAADKSFALSGWFKYGATNPAASEFIVNKTSGNAGYAVYMDTDGDVIFGTGDASSASFPEDKVGDLGVDRADGLWHYFTAVKNETNSLELYIDGLSVQKNSALAATSTLATSGILYVADANATDGTDEFLGSLDEIKIFNYALSADDVKLDYNRNKSAVLGALSTESDGASPSFSSSRSYCPPGFTDTCTAPKAEWTFDEKTGTTAYDVSSNGKDGTLTNGPLWKSGKYGSSVYMDGTDDYVAISDAIISPASDFTAEMWIKPESDNETPRLISLVNGTDKFQGGIATSTSKIFFKLTDASASTTVAATDAIAYNTWQHVAWVRRSGVNHIYIDGYRRATSTIDIGSDEPSASAIGGGVAGYTGKGYFDEVRIYDYARTPAQIAWDYDKGKPQGWIRMNEGEGATVHDESGHGNNFNFYAGMDSNSAWENGKLGYALHFDGSDDGLSCVSTTSLNFPEAVSVSAWVNFNSIIGGDTGRTIYSKGSQSANNHYWLFYHTGGYFTWELGNNGVSRIYARYDILPVLSTWYHVTGTYNSTGGVFNFYLNGNKVSTNASSTFGEVGGTATKAIIGSYNNSTGHSFDGIIDDVRVYSYNLSPAQVKTIYNEGAAVKLK